MMMRHLWRGVAAAAIFLLPQSTYGLGTITYVGKTMDVTDFGDAGSDLGNFGYWFAQFDAAGPVTNAPIDDNDRNSLPAWIIPTFSGDDSSFGDLVFSEGGNTSWNTFTLPNGESGLSGSLVDPEAENNSNNTISSLVFGADVPSSFLVHVVVDNTNNMHDTANRIRMRAEDGVTGSDTDFRVNTTADDFNGIADVYTFRLQGWVGGDFMKMQLNSGVAGVQPGFAGLMFDVPEPASGSIALVGVALLACARRRKS